MDEVILVQPVTALSVRPKQIPSTGQIDKIILLHYEPTLRVRQLAKWEKILLPIGRDEQLLGGS
jgi:hypothetical protein